MLYNVEPDRSITGGAWYSDQDFESEFVDVLNQQSHRFLEQAAQNAKALQVEWHRLTFNRTALSVIVTKSENQLILLSIQLFYHNDDGAYKLCSSTIIVSMHIKSYWIMLSQVFHLILIEFLNFPNNITNILNWAF